MRAVRLRAKSLTSFTRLQHSSYVFEVYSSWEHTNHFLQNTHLDRQQLSYCVSLIENGANPEALAVSQFLFLPDMCSVTRDRIVYASFERSVDCCFWTWLMITRRTESHTATARRIPDVVCRWGRRGCRRGRAMKLGDVEVMTPAYGRKQIASYRLASTQRSKRGV